MLADVEPLELLGLPRVGPFDRPLDDLPFHLVTEEAAKPRSGPAIVEVHPAVAAWLWCRDGWQDGATWRYKQADAAREAMSRRVQDDELDARIAFALGSLWLSSDAVVLLGDLEQGTFLLPRVEGLERSFRTFLGRAQPV